MATLDLKKSVLNYIDNADDRLLKLIKALVETYQEKDSDYEISEEHRKVLDQRLADHKANPDSGKAWKVLKPELRKKWRIKSSLNQGLNWILGKPLNGMRKKKKSWRWTS